MTKFKNLSSGISKSSAIALYSVLVSIPSISLAAPANHVAPRDQVGGIVGTGEKTFGIVGTGEKTLGIVGTGEKTLGIVGTGEKTLGIVGTGQKTLGIVGTGEKTLGIVGTGEKTLGIVGTGEKTLGIVGTGEKTLGIVGTGEKTLGIVGTGEKTFGIVGTGEKTLGVVSTGEKTQLKECEAQQFIGDNAAAETFRTWAAHAASGQFPLLIYGTVQNLTADGFVVLNQQVSSPKINEAPAVQPGQTVGVFGVHQGGSVIAMEIVVLEQALVEGSSLVFLSGTPTEASGTDGAFKIGSLTINVGSAGSDPRAFQVRDGIPIEVAGTLLGDLVLADSLKLSSPCGPDSK